jgi:hypothetical protein
MMRELVIYGLVPTDIPSLREPNGPGRGGKVAAHALHAGNQILKYSKHKLVKAYIEDGLKQGADYFNTCITLDCTSKQLETAVKMANRLGYVADKVEDPTYPFFVSVEVAKLLGADCTVIWETANAGQVLVTRKQVTFGWVLGDKNDPVFRAMFANFKLAS